MAGISTAALVAGRARVLGQADGKERKMTKCLSCGAIGVVANQERAIELAAKHGFESVEADAGFLAGLDQGAADALVGEMKGMGLELGYSALPVEFRRDEETFKRGLDELPKKAAGLKRAGLKRVGTWLMPCHNELTYLENFKQHADRLRQVAKVLGDSALMLGFEYVGTATLMASRKYPFLHTMAETRELNAAIGTDNVGLVLDSWHWWQAGDSAEAIRELKSEEIALVDLNDAPKGVEKNAQVDGKRELPVATSVIDVKPFLESLAAIDYDGPVRAEPFNQALRDLGDDAACRETSAALGKGFALLDG